MQTLFQRPDQISQPLHVVTVVFNAQRFRSRWRLYQDYQKMVAASGAILFTVEVAFGNRKLVLKDIAGKNYLGLRGNDELWLKENALNLGFQRLPCDWKYAGWLDSDVAFARPDWANEILHGLQHYHVIQPFSQVADLNRNYQIISIFDSYSKRFAEGKLSKDSAGYYQDGTGHPGFGMFLRRSAFDDLGGFIDWAILGSADRHMWDFLTGTVRNWPAYLGAGGVRMCKEWANRAKKLHKNVGFIQGLLLHYWHGSKQHRGYEHRRKLLIKANFDPDRDLYRDWQGLWQLRKENITLRNGLRTYFQSRNEDQ